MSKQEAHTQNASTWSLSEIYRQARELTFAHKELWFLGALGLLISQGSSSSFDWMDDLPSNTNGALNDPNSWDAAFERGVTLIQNIWQALPGHVSALTITLAVIFFVLGIVWSVFVYLWVQSTLIKAVQKARTEKQVALFRTLRESLKHVPALLWLMIIPTLALYAGLIVSLIIFFIIIAAVPESAGIFPSVGLILAAIASIPLAIRVATAVHWGTRHAVLEHKSGKEALRSGWKTSHRNILKTIGLGISNSIVGGILSLLLLVPLTALAVVLFLPVFSGESFQWWILAPLGGMTLVTIVATAAFHSLWNIFTTATWQFGFESLQARKESRT